MKIEEKLDLIMKKICEHHDFQFCKYHALFERLDKIEEILKKIIEGK